jgi:hypothetical protein
MHVLKAHDELLKLLDSAPANLETLTTAAMLFDGLERDNMDPNEGERSNEIVNDKLHSARNWFEILCGVGEDGGWAEDHLRELIRKDLSGAAIHIADGGLHYKYWPA